MATDPIIPGNTVNIVRTKIANGAGATTNYYALDPNKLTSINLVKNSETVTLSVTNDLKGEDSNLWITDLEGAGILWNARTSDTTDYLAGDSAGLTGVKITATPAAADVEYSIIQFDRK